MDYMKDATRCLCYRVESLSTKLIIVFSLLTEGEKPAEEAPAATEGEPLITIFKKIYLYFFRIQVASPLDSIIYIFISQKGKEKTF